MSEKNYTIYTITNPNGKVYIGQTKNLKERIRKHRADSSRCIKLKNSINYYGWENHKLFVLFENLTKQQADECEIHLIDAWNTIDNGLNILKGGSGLNAYWKGRKHSDKTKQKMRDSVTEERIQLIKNLHLGKKHSEEHKQKIVQSRVQNNPIKLFRNDKSNHLVEVKNIREFARKEKLDLSTLYRVINGKAKHHKNWIYIGEKLC